MAHSWLDADGIIRRLSELRTGDVGGGTTSNLPYHLQLEREHEGEAGLDAPPGFSEMIRANIGDLTPPEMRDFLQGARALLVQHTGELPANHYITRELAQMDHQLVEAEHRGSRGPVRRSSSSPARSSCASSPRAPGGATTRLVARVPGTRPPHGRPALRRRP